MDYGIKIGEANPLLCHCGKLMKLVAIVGDKGLVEATLRVLGLREDPLTRRSHIDLSAVPPPELEREPWWDDFPADA